MRKLTSTKQEGEEFHKETEVLNDHVTLNKNWLLVKLITDRPFNKDAFKITMCRAWKPIHPMVFRELGNLVFMAEFTDVRDKAWSFDKHLVITKEVEGALQVYQMNFSQALF